MEAAVVRGDVKALEPMLSADFIFTHQGRLDRRRRAASGTVEDDVAHVGREAAAAVFLPRYSMHVPGTTVKGPVREDDGELTPTCRKDSSSLRQHLNRLREPGGARLRLLRLGVPTSNTSVLFMYSFSFVSTTSAMTIKPSFDAASQSDARRLGRCPSIAAAIVGAE